MWFAETERTILEGAAPAVLAPVEAEHEQRYRHNATAGARGLGLPLRLSARYARKMRDGEVEAARAGGGTGHLARQANLLWRYVALGTNADDETAGLLRDYDARSVALHTPVLVAEAQRRGLESASRDLEALRTEARAADSRRVIHERARLLALDGLSADLSNPTAPSMPDTPGPNVPAFQPPNRLINIAAGGGPAARAHVAEARERLARDGFATFEAHVRTLDGYVNGWKAQIEETRAELRGYVKAHFKDEPDEDRDALADFLASFEVFLVCDPLNLPAGASAFSHGFGIAEGTEEFGPRLFRDVLRAEIAEAHEPEDERYAGAIYRSTLANVRRLQWERSRCELVRDTYRFVLDDAVMGGGALPAVAQADGTEPPPHAEDVPTPGTDRPHPDSAPMPDNAPALLPAKNARAKWPPLAAFIERALATASERGQLAEARRLWKLLEASDDPAVLAFCEARAIDEDTLTGLSAGRWSEVRTVGLNYRARPNG